MKQNSIIILLLLWSSLSIAQPCRQQDSLQLVTFYNATNGANWTNRTNWLTINPIYTWHGIQVNAAGCVSSINLTQNNLSGTLPNLDLPNLKSLVVTQNINFTASIPIFNLPLLETLDLNSNNLSGSIPNFNNLPNLKTLILSLNRNMSGTLSDFNLPNLQILSLVGTSLVGTLPNFNLPNLKELHLATNNLTGVLPNFNNLPNLQILSVGSNSLTGTIPDWNNLPNLQNIQLYNNRLTGTLPNFGALPQLRRLDLGWNSLTGTIPNWNLPLLQNLGLNNNQLTDCIPANLRINSPLIGAANGNITNNSNLTTQNWADYWNNGTGACIATPRRQDSLALVDLYNATGGANWTNRTNWLSANPLETWYGIRLTQERVTCIDLDGTVDCYINGSTGNNLSGILPFSLNNLSGLQFLSLRYNRLTGALLNFNLPNLQELWLHNNQFTGSIPNFTLPNLKYLFLFSNQLSGTIPNFNLPQLESLQLYSNQLSGNIPNFNLPNLVQLHLASNQLSGTIPNFNLPKLGQLLLYSNQLSGSIPNFNLPMLWVMHLYSNQLTGNIPNFNLPNLTAMELYSNQLSGKIPNLTVSFLQRFWVQNNQLSGCIPDSLRRNCPLAVDGNVSGNPNLATQNWADYWNNGTGACRTPTDEVSKEWIQIYPNPTQGWFTVASSEPLSLIRVYNSVGQWIRDFVATQNQIEIDLTAVPTGIYRVKVGEKVYKIWKQ